jgi:hypothetical protein
VIGSHASHIKIFDDGCNSVQFHWIDKHAVSLWLYNSPRRLRHAVTFSRQFVGCLQIVDVQGCLFQKCNECPFSNTTWHLLLNCKNKFRDAFPDFCLPNQSTVSCLVNCFRDTGSVQDRNSSCWLKAQKAAVISSTKYNNFFWLQRNLFFDKCDVSQVRVTWLLDRSV